MRRSILAAIVAANGSQGRRDMRDTWLCYLYLVVVAHGKTSILIPSVDTLKRFEEWIIHLLESTMDSLLKEVIFIHHIG